MVKRARAFARLAEADHCTVEQIDDVAKRLKIGRAMVYRLLARFRKARETTALLPRTAGRKPGSRFLKKEQERIIEELIRRFYLTRQKPSVAALHRIIALECFNTAVPIPSYKAVTDRVASLNPQDVVRAREGARVASERFRLLKASPRITEPLELVQIDHTLVDIIVVDETERKPIRRPWLSVAIDVATRTVLGFHLSLRAPSAASVALTIARAVLRKDDFLAGLGVDSTWPVYGLPRTIHLDNAKEFRGRALVRGCEQHGIGIVHRPPLRPHFGGHVERLIGTLMGEVHLLPGTTFRSVEERGDYDSTKNAAMTLAEVEAWLAWQITGIYHLRPHTALGCAPLTAWQLGIKNARLAPREPADQKRFYIDFLPFEKRSIGRAGLRMFNILYWHGALGKYVNDGRKHIVKYDPRDISRVYLLENNRSYLEIPYRDLSLESASLDEIRAGAKLLRADGQSVENQQRLFQAVQKQRELIETAKKRTLQARRQVQVHAESKQPDQTEPTPKPISEPEPDLPAEPFPFEIWRE